MIPLVLNNLHFMIFIQGPLITFFVRRDCSFLPSFFHLRKTPINFGTAKRRKVTPLEEQDGLNDPLSVKARPNVFYDQLGHFKEGVISLHWL